MKKRVINELNNLTYALDIMLYAIIVVAGYLLLNGNAEKVEVTSYVISIFFIFGFFSLLAYFLNRKEDDYELLIFGGINVFAAVFVLANRNSTDIEFIITSSLLVYSVIYLINKLFHVYKLFKKKSINFIPKCSIAILVFILSLIAVYAISGKIDVAFMIYGYYFIGFGLLSILEVLLIILMNGKTFKKKMLKFLDYKEEKKEVKKKVEIKKMKQVRGKRITPKKVEKVEKEIIVNVQPKKKKMMKKKDNK